MRSDRITDYKKLPNDVFIIAVTTDSDLEDKELELDPDQPRIPTKCQVCGKDAWLPFGAMPMLLTVGPDSSARVCFNCLGEFSVNYEAVNGPADKSVFSTFPGCEETVNKIVNKIAKTCRERHEQN
jgi:hypothetical protein